MMMPDESAGRDETTSTAAAASASFRFIDDYKDDEGKEYTLDETDLLNRVATTSPLSTAQQDDSNDDATAAEPDDFENFMRHIFDTTVDGPCRGVSYTMPESFCTIDMEKQLDLLSHCRRPSEFLSFFREHQTPEGVVTGVEVLPAGAYVTPTFCEYCQAKHMSLCDAKTCQRPRLFFQKKRPPFSSPDAAKWDETTDHAIDASVDRHVKGPAAATAARV